MHKLNSFFQKLTTTLNAKHFSVIPILSPYRSLKQECITNHPLEVSRPSLIKVLHHSYGLITSGEISSWTPIPSWAYPLLEVGEDAFVLIGISYQDKLSAVCLLSFDITIPDIWLLTRAYKLHTQTQINHEYVQWLTRESGKRRYWHIPEVGKVPDKTIQVAEKVALGLSYEAIAEKLNMSRGSVGYHVASAVGLFNAKDQAELSAKIVKLQLANPFVTT